MSDFNITSRLLNERIFMGNSDIIDRETPLAIQTNKYISTRSN